MTRPKTILWVDDEVDALAAHALFLQEHGFAVERTPHGDDALALLRKQPYGVVLLDEQLPGRRGLELVGEIRAIDPAVPLVMVTKSEEAGTMREAALSLGIPQWKVTLQVLYRSALPGIVTGILLALARISGETAPLLFTALNNQYWTTDILAPMANVPVVIFQYAMSPYASWHSLAWAGAFILTLFVLLTSLVARAIVSRNRVGHD